MLKIRKKYVNSLINANKFQKEEHYATFAKISH